MPYLLAEDAQSFTILTDGNQTQVIPRSGLSQERLAQLQSMPRAPGIQPSAIGGGSPMAQAATALAPAAVGLPRGGLEMKAQQGSPTTPAPKPEFLTSGGLPAGTQAPLARGPYPKEGTVHEPMDLRKPPDKLEFKASGTMPFGKKYRLTAPTLQGFEEERAKLEENRLAAEKITTQRDLDVKTQADEMQRKESLRETAAQNVEIEIGNLEKEVLDFKIDPANFFNKQDSSQKILLGIAMMIHGMGNAMQGGDPANSMKLINSAIDRDIDAQKAELAGKKAVIGFKGNALSRMTRRFGDERVAESVVRAQQHQLFKDKLNTLSGNTANVRAQSILKNMANANEQSAVNYRNDAKKFAYQQEMGRLELSLKASKQVGKGQKQVGEKTIVQLSGFDSAIKQVAILKKSFGDNTGPFSILSQFVPGSDARQYKKARNAFAVSIVKAISGAQVTDKEREYILALIPSAETWDSDAGTMFKAIEDFVYEKRLETVRALKESGYDTGAYDPNILSPEPTPGRVSTLPGEAIF